MPTSRFSNFRFHREPAWRQFKRVPETVVPQPWRAWLLDQGSLTQRILDACEGDFRLEVLNQRLELPRLSEMRALSLPSRQLALIREIVMYGKGEPWVYARSVIPLTTLTGRLRSLRKLDNRPLGAMLFKDPSMTRKPMEIACLAGDNSQFPEALGKLDVPMWGRRSVFCLDRKPLLVSEIFLPAFAPYNQTLPIGFPRKA